MAGFDIAVTRDLKASAIAIKQADPGLPMSMLKASATALF